MTIDNKSQTATESTPKILSKFAMLDKKADQLEIAATKEEANVATLPQDTSIPLKVSS